MHKYRLTIVLILMLVGLTRASAQDELHVGYCYGQLAKQSAATAKDDRWVDAAIWLPAERMESCVGNAIAAVRVGMVARVNVETVRVWVRSSLTGDNLAEGEITATTTPKISKGWNVVTLDKPCPIAEGEGLYVGFSYKQRTEASVLSAVGTGSEGSFFARLDGDGEWQDLSIKGALSVEAVVRGDRLPDYDLALVAADARPNSATGEVDFTVDVRNMALRDITGFTLAARLAGYDFEATQHIDTTIAPGEGATVSFSAALPDVAGIGNAYPVEVGLTALDDGDDRSPSNDRVVAAYCFRRKVLVEEFTTERCGNCPRVAGYLHEVLADKRYADKAVAVCHHSAFGTDGFTKPADLDYEWFYQGSTYAPGMMFDRTTLPSGSCVVCPGMGDIQYWIDRRQEEPCYAQLIIEADRISQEQVVVTVSGVRSKPFCTTPARLTVCLLEDNIRSTSQSGASGEYYQMHVERYINSTWGDIVEWDENRFTATYTIDVSPAWDDRNLSIVAFIGSYDPADCHNCVVENAEQKACPRFGADATGIGVNEESATPQARGNTSCYDLQGRVVGNEKTIVVSRQRKILMR